jgi:DNA polymerase
MEQLNLFQTENNFEVKHLDDLRQIYLDCTDCSLHDFPKTGAYGRVQWRGNPKSKIVLVGEAPGETEVLTNQPFTGTSGKLLDELFQEIGIDTNTLFLTNVIKCRPNGNRKPNTFECLSCGKYLLREISIINPKLIIAVGSTAGAFLLKKSKLVMNDSAGKLYPMDKYKLLVLYHPAAILYERLNNSTVIADATRQHLKTYKKMLLDLINH